MAKIPVVDISPLFSSKTGGTDETVATQIEQALSKVGFVYLKNHGIPKDKILKAFQVSKDFFQLPFQLKNKYNKAKIDTFHGYSAPGQELLNKASTHEIRETFDVRQCQGRRLDVYPNAQVPEFRAALWDLRDSCHPLIQALHRVLAKALKLDNIEFFNENSSWIQDDNCPSITDFRVLYYPKMIDGQEVKGGAVRCAEHTDYGILTLLFQDDIGGLEVKRADGTWIQAKPIEDSILVNTGDLLDYWTGGYFPATMHRVLIPEEELRRRVPRQSIAYFIHPDDKAEVEPLIKSAGANVYGKINAAEHALRKLKASYNY